MKYRAIALATLLSTVGCSTLSPRRELAAVRPTADEICHSLLVHTEGQAVGIPVKDHPNLKTESTPEGTLVRNTSAKSVTLLELNIHAGGSAFIKPTNLVPGGMVIVSSAQNLSVSEFTSTNAASLAAILQAEGSMYEAAQQVIAAGCFPYQAHKLIVGTSTSASIQLTDGRMLGLSENRFNDPRPFEDTPIDQGSIRLGQTNIYYRVYAQSSEVTEDEMLAFEGITILPSGYQFRDWNLANVRKLKDGRFVLVNPRAVWAPGTSRAFLPARILKAEQSNYRRMFKGEQTLALYDQLSDRYYSWAEKQELETNWKSIFERTRASHFDPSFAAIKAARQYPSDTIRTSERSRDEWDKADLLMRQWVAERRPPTAELLNTLNTTLNPPDWTRAKRSGLRDGDLEIKSADQRDIPNVLKEFELWYQGARSLPTIEVAALAGQRIVSAHPFSNGNGRTARLLVDWILLVHGLPPAAWEASTQELSVSDVTPLRAVQNVTRAVQHSLDVLTGK